MENNINTDLAPAFNFLNELTYMLSDAQKMALQKKILPLIKKYGLTSALHNMLSSCDPSEYWLYIHVDIRDYRELEWQAQAAVETHGIKEIFSWQPHNTEIARFYHGLVAFSAWLSLHRFSLVVWGEADDMYRNFIVPNERLTQFISIAKAAGLNCYALNTVTQSFNGFVVEKVIDKNMTLISQVAESAKQAHIKGYKTYLYITTSWCEPCRQVFDAFNSPVFAKILKNSHIITIDYDFWLDQIDKLIPIEKLTSVPIFATIDENGIFMGRIQELDSDNEDDNTPTELVRVFGDFFTVPVINISIKNQTITLVGSFGEIKAQYPVSTAANGAGCEKGSGCTPLGLHIVRAKIGAGAEPNTVFVGRRPTGEIYTPELMLQYPNRDWILTRILWLSGTEIGKNRLGNVDTMQRYIYIHGTPNSTDMSKVGSHGCVRMRNADVIALFDLVEVGTRVLILE